MPTGTLDLAKPQAKIAILEDDPIVGKILNTALLEHGYDVDWFTRGLDCVRGIEQNHYDACILDWMLPDVSGPDVMFQVNRRRTKAPLPVIFVTSKSEESDMIRILAAGADDYIIKPVSTGTFLARLDALLRRSGTKRAAQRKRWGRLEADFANKLIRVDGSLVDLSPIEAMLACYFLENTGLLVTRPHLLQVIWHSNSEQETRKVDVYVSRVRRKLEWTEENQWNLASIYRSGYRLEWLGNS